MLDTTDAAATGEVPAADASRSARLMAAVLVPLSFLAFILRWLYATRSGIWRDEALVLDIVRQPGGLAHMLEFLRLHESHPPLFYLILRGWQAVFGTGELAALVLPVLCGVALVPVIYLVGCRLFSRRAALFAAVAVACSPILAEHSALIRPYSLLPLLAVGSLYALHRGLSGAGWRWWAAFVATTEAMLWIHNWSVLVVPAEAIVAGLWCLGGYSRPRGEVAKELVAGFGAVAVLYLPWLPTLLYQARHAGHAPSEQLSVRFVISLLAKCMTSVPNWYVAVGVVVVLGVAAWRAARADRAPERRLAFWLFAGVPLVSLAFATVLSVSTEALWPRTVLIVIPPLLLVGLEGLAHWVPRRGGTLAVTVALAGFYLAIALGMLSLPKSNAREVATAVASHSAPNDLILLTPEWVCAGFNWYFPGTNPQIDYPYFGKEIANAWDDLGPRLADEGAFRRTRAAVQEAFDRKRRLWFITDEAMIWRHPVPEVGLPPDLPVKQWNEVGLYRTNQLLEYVARIYGSPTKRVVTPDATPGGENLVAFRFDPAVRHPAAAGAH